MLSLKDMLLPLGFLGALLAVVALVLSLVAGRLWEAALALLVMGVLALAGWALRNEG